MASSRHSSTLALFRSRYTCSLLTPARVLGPAAASLLTDSADLAKERALTTLHKRKVSSLLSFSMRAAITQVNRGIRQQF